MLNKRINVENLEKCIININNVSYKFSKATIINIDKSLNHLKKYKKVYKCIVAYIAICMSPIFAKFSVILISEFMHALAIYPVDRLINECLKMLLVLGKWITIFVGMTELLKTLISSAYKEAKNKFKI